MTIPFPDLNPYETLQVQQSATEQDIKKSYRKLCLLHHPDKLINKTDNEIAQSKLQFEKIQFAHMILSNVDKRTRYDKTGSLEEIDSDASFDWFEYFTNIKAEITQESIMKDKSEYQGSSDEEEDIIEMWLENNGDFLNLFETIPHTEITWGDESRLFNKITGLINDGVIESTKNWEIYQKNRKNLFKNLLKSLKDESKEAEELQKELLKDKKIDTEDDLKQLIQKRNAGRIDDLISNLEAKYGAKNSKVKKPKKNTKKHGITGSKRKEYEINDDEFAKLQQKMMNRKK
ncbi:unnamed protein product [Wickerhamomyces anomalus]